MNDPFVQADAILLFRLSIPSYGLGTILRTILTDTLHTDLAPKCYVVAAVLVIGWTSLSGRIEKGVLNAFYRRQDA
ncbi:hypothetical protein LTR37_008251 [Vermiconidia calcicola]|uniref:Uncharacterized protein n=1 Tax=Vermiconidia calcicola TaxID=1690605 RepID=A0ACC3NB46_9PEZI|nr:hypothetical protein LTR37_008251 [Vermiconidia calcicola]